MDAKDRKNALNEIRILASLDHPQIVGYKDAFYDKKSQSLWIIMEYAEGGDLQRIIDSNKKAYKNIPESDVWKYAIHMINGIKYLHENKIVHRDLKVRYLPEWKFLNLYFTDINHFSLISELMNFIVCKRLFD